MVVRKLEGIPKQASTDCGSENTIIYELGNALKEAFATNGEGDDNKPAHVFLRSVHHIPIERGWVDFRRDFGQNFFHFWDVGAHIYNHDNVIHRKLAMWLWPPVIQKECDRFVEIANNRRMRKQIDKLLPSGVPPMYTYSFPERFGARDCLQPVNVQIVDEILSEMEDEKNSLSSWDVPEEFAEQCRYALRMVAVEEVNTLTIWPVFSGMLRYL